MRSYQRFFVYSILIIDTIPVSRVNPGDFIPGNLDKIIFQFGSGFAGLGLGTIGNNSGNFPGMV